ncbi:MAG: nucleotidyl transferase AbiEii/AbiGii toxin family protein [Candidatus Diapherotrites archaeon]|uniref:Nucleotidyl transferase AbiEii/AbiGii toxin family protein n=1 Tax=Candidatus Iainarchaeum sp. TaxID=3101447 RepID=A0A8T3YRI9_9ARCH|nr:nucleotidyl transferase AbiEii/AbiGii toxin family protein [Candidatus Diapherotrites archaeon]
MDAKTLKSQSAKQGIPQATLEKDYALSIVLKEISQSNLKNKLIFKGGTAIKKIYFANARFSEDLDFTARNATQEEIESALRAIFENKRITDINFFRLSKEKTTAGLRLAIKFTSALNHPQSIRFDISFRDNIVLKPVEIEVIDTYSLGKSSAMVLHLEEIFAEKIQALLTRTVARDLYDTWYLLKNNVKLDRQTINKKFGFYKEEFDSDKLESKITGFQVNWDRDLQQFLKQVPDYEATAKEVTEWLKSA